MNAGFDDMRTPQLCNIEYQFRHAPALIARFVGERVLDFEVYKTNKDGTPLDATDHVLEKRRYKHECTIVIYNEWDFTTARLLVDSVPFSQLTVQPQRHEEQCLSVNPSVLLHSYGITTPYKVDKNAPSNVMAMANQMLGTAQSSKSAAGGFFANCFDCDCVRDDRERIVR